MVRSDDTDADTSGIFVDTDLVTDLVGRSGGRIEIDRHAGHARAEIILPRAS
jgi:hypothetical protein